MKSWCAPSQWTNNFRFDVIIFILEKSRITDVAYPFIDWFTWSSLSTTARDDDVRGKQEVGF